MSDILLVECAREGCDVSFEKKTHNQIYHDNDCTKLATNKRILQRYHRNRDRRAGVERACDNCGSKLSRYNDSDVCSACDTKKQAELKNSVKDMILSVSWQV